MRKDVEDAVRRLRWRRVEERFLALEAWKEVWSLDETSVRFCALQHTESHVGSHGFKSTLMGKHWPQSRLHAAGIVTSANWRLCVCLLASVATTEPTPPL